ncbi:MAG: transporter substrate-binding domain-containing protein [Enterobacterales bacterium]|nr:transporter substrate-binding domain-containing protein [Enterobacterales bacterium]
MKKILALCFLMLTASITFAEEKTVYLTSLDWPPYSGKKLEGGGASIEVARAAFAAMGYKLVVEFYPWSRTVNLAKDESSKYAGYFPEYYSDAVAKEFNYSEVMGNGPLGFAEKADSPKEWNSISDLEKYSIGVIQDYVNDGAEFDAAVAAGKIKVQAVTSDATNLVKLLNGRIDLAVVDMNVMDYILNTDKRFKGKKDKLQLNKKLLVDNKLYVAFKKNVLGDELLKVFNEGLTKIDVKAIMEKGMK